MFLRRALLFACLGSLSVACPGARSMAALAHPSAQDAYRTSLAATVDALSLRGNAPSLATAALISRDFGALGLASRADDLTPDDTAIGWIHLRVCALTPNCDIRGSATEMRWLDPDNSAAWLPTLAAALKDRDSVELDRVLAHMARGTRVDFYWNRIVVMMFDAMKSVSGRVRGRYADSDATRLSYVTSIAVGESRAVAIEARGRLPRDQAGDRAARVLRENREHFAARRYGRRATDGNPDRAPLRARRQQGISRAR